VQRYEKDLIYANIGSIFSVKTGKNKEIENKHAAFAMRRRRRKKGR